MAVLVTGGAGYIGSVTAELLRERGQEVVVVDDLYRGHREAVHASIPFYQGRVGDRQLIARIAREHKLDACMHFAALTFVGESVAEPLRYFSNNTEQAIALLDELTRAGVRHVVFSSTAATYGEPQQVPISESHPRQPANPYGWSKYFVERVLENAARAGALSFVALRYFNAAGATAAHGEDHEPEGHLIPIVLSVAAGLRDAVPVFGTDYPTPDGTAIRDYIHVGDLAQAHLLALDHLRRGGASEYINLGNGSGYSVLEVIETARRVTGHAIPIRTEPRRAGDPTRLIADARKAAEVLNWKPSHPGLEPIVRSAWEWMQAHPGGYGAASRRTVRAR